MSKSLPSVTYPALQLLLLRQLQEVICLRSDVFPPKGLSTTLKIETGLLPDRESKPPVSLQRVKEKIPILYASAIALQLAKPCRQPALFLANTIADQFFAVAIAENLRDQQGLEDSGFSLRNFTVKVEPPGWLYFELNGAGLAAWLQLLTQMGNQFPLQECDLITPLFAPEHASPSSSVLSSRHVFDSFAVQYAHARCCSLLRLALAQNLGAEGLNNTSDLSRLGAITQPISWLNPEGELRFIHPAERSLIFALIDTVDELSNLIVAAIAQPSVSQGRSRVEKLAATLAQAFLSFYDACRFWGEVRQQDPALVQARLGLVLATQCLLQFILREVLGFIAPVEL